MLMVVPAQLTGILLRRCAFGGSGTAWALTFKIDSVLDIGLEIFVSAKTLIEAGRAHSMIGSRSECPSLGFREQGNQPSTQPLLNFSSSCREGPWRFMVWYTSDLVWRQTGFHVAWCSVKAVHVFLIRNSLCPCLLSEVFAFIYLMFVFERVPSFFEKGPFFFELGLYFYNYYYDDCFWEDPFEVYNSVA